MMRMLRRISIPILFLLSFLCGCREVAVPKPRGYFRIDLPVREYRPYVEETSAEGMIPLTFEYPAYGEISYKSDNSPEPGWFNIEFPKYRARIYLTYKAVNNDLAGLIEQSYRMNVRNHIIKADAINEQIITDYERNIYGILYDLRGNTATSVQFFVTDSINHFLRGSLYFDAEPHADSLAPVTEFFREDIIHLIETLRWK